MGSSLGILDIVYGLGLAALIMVFVVSAGAKLRDVVRARDGLVSFGVPERWSLALVYLLIALELLIAALLALPATRAAGAWSAIAALAVFSCAIARQLARGNRPACACFGALSRSSIGWHSIARNLLLQGLAATVLAFPAAAGALPQLRIDMFVFVALVWATLVTAWLLLLSRQNGRLLLRIEQLERAPSSDIGRQRTADTGPLQPGAAVPPLALSDARGLPFDQHSLRGAPLMLLFLDAGCSHCRPLLEQLQQRRPAGASLAVISESAALQRELPGAISVLVDPARAAAALFGVRGTPAAVLIDAAGALAQAPVHGTAPVRAMLEQHTSGEVQYEWAPV